MRILFITAFYPPYVLGGWEQLVEDLNLGLRQRGHETLVLTSTHGMPQDQAEPEPDVARVLTLESNLQYYRPADFLGYRRRLQRNLENTRATIERWQPDVVFVHIMWNLTRAIPWLAEQLLPGRVVYYVADHWPYMPDTHTAYWTDAAGDPVRRTLKRAVAVAPLHMIEQDRRRYALAFARVLCVSHAIRAALLANTSIPPDQLEVVYNGIDVAAFAFQARRRAEDNRSLRLLYAGSLFPHKGVQTAVEAMAVLAERGELDGLTLTIVGSGRPDYEAQLRAAVAANELDAHVHFAGRVPRTEMPAQLATHDALIFPSEWPEPLARMTQEAMASGAVVIGTTTGGTGEILVHGETGLTFPPGDAAALADCICALRRQPDLFARLARQARTRVEAQFDFRRMLDQVESELGAVVVEGTRPPPAAGAAKRRS